ncbi:hypothetical protein ACFLXE_07770 [Chloroflexota bacterium]
MSKRYFQICLISVALVMILAIITPGDTLGGSGDQATVPTGVITVNGTTYELEEGLVIEKGTATNKTGITVSVTGRGPGCFSAEIHQDEDGNKLIVKNVSFSSEGCAPTPP